MPAPTMRIEVLGSYGGESRRVSPDRPAARGRRSRSTPAAYQGTARSSASSSVQSVVLTHSHMDHTTALPFLVDNVFGKRGDAVDIYGSPATIYAVRRHLFNNATWPDFTRLPNHLLPAMRFQGFRPRQPFARGDHLHADRGQPRGADPRLPDRTGRRGRALVERYRTDQAALGDRQPDARPQGGVLEVSFDNALQPIADLSKHLTPQTMAVEIQQLKRRMPVLLHHLKPTCIARIEENVKALANPDVGFLEQGKVYEI